MAERADNWRERSSASNSVIHRCPWLSRHQGEAEVTEGFDHQIWKFIIRSKRLLIKIKGFDSHHHTQTVNI